MPTIGLGFTLRDANRFIHDVQRLVIAARAVNLRLEAWAGSDEGPGYDGDEGCRHVQAVLEALGERAGAQEVV